MSGPSEKDVREIRWRVEGIDNSVDLLVRANRKQIVEDLMEFFGKSTERVRVFLEIDGEKSVEDIRQSLSSEKGRVFVQPCVGTTGGSKRPPVLFK